MLCDDVVYDDLLHIVIPMFSAQTLQHSRDQPEQEPAPTPKGLMLQFSGQNLDEEPHLDALRQLILAD